MVLSRAGLVEFEYGYPRLIHLSLWEYSIGQGAADQTFRVQNSGLRFIPSPSEAHTDSALACVQHLTYLLPAKPLSGEVGRDANIVDIQHAFPFCAYASAFGLRTSTTYTQMTILRRTQAPSVRNTAPCSLDFRLCSSKN